MSKTIPVSNEVHQELSIRKAKGKYSSFEMLMRDLLGMNENEQSDSASSRDAREEKTSIEECTSNAAVTN